MRFSLLFPILGGFMATVYSQTTTANGTMRRVEYKGVPYNISVASAATPQLLEPDDAIIRITTAALCGTDLHSYRGFSGPTSASGDIGHEAIGVIEALGVGVTTLSVGDYVVIPASGRQSGLETAPTLPGRGSSGLQAEYALVPAADANLIPVPLAQNTTSPSLERDYLLIGDVWPTAWQGLTWSGFEAGDTVAVWGAGPVGLLAAYSAKLRGASKIFVIDRIQRRLDVAKSIGAIPINFETQNITQIIASQAPGGVMRQVEAVGFEAFNPSLKHDPNYIWSQMLAIAHYGGGIGFPGLWAHSGVSSPLAPRAGEIPNNITLPYTQFWLNKVSLSGGVVVPSDTAGELVRLISSGVASGIGDSIMTADINIEAVPEYYARFERWEEIKVFITFT